MLVNVVLVKREYTKAVTINKHTKIELDDLVVELSNRQLDSLLTLIQRARENPGTRFSYLD